MPKLIHNGNTNEKNNGEAYHRKNFLIFSCVQWANCKNF